MKAYLPDQVFDGAALLPGHAVIVSGGEVLAVCPQAELPGDVAREALPGQVLAPGFVDLQVNGGGGLMLGEARGQADLARILAAHAAMGTAWLLPTLITAERAVTARVIDLVAGADLPGLAGLHLEGPHLSQARKGAHDGALIRPMEDADLALLVEAAARLPALVVTVAPEAVTEAQVAALVAAGVVVSLGHSAADYEACLGAFAAGAGMATHLYNAMEPVRGRAPGLVSAALDAEGVAVGIIADGIHVHPAHLRRAARDLGGRLFLVSDAMAVAGTDLEGFALDRRAIRRQDGRLTLADGTLAGADLTLPEAVRVMTAAGTPLAEALAMVTRIPAAVIGREAVLRAGAPGVLTALDPVGATARVILG